MRLIIALLVAALTWKIYKAENEICVKPEVYRRLWYIYRIVEMIDVTVYHCFAMHTLHIYSDITENCIQAFNTGVYKDKWNDTQRVTTSSPIMIKSYKAKADIFQNEIILKSGTICRYDRGFCYDPRESFDYAAVWKVIDKRAELKDSDVDQIFYGWADTWAFRKNGLEYLVFQDNQIDRSFSFQLLKKDNIRDKNVWYTEHYGIIASRESLQTSVKSTPGLNQNYLRLQPKHYVSEHILRSCELENFPLDFERKVDVDYLSDLYNLKAILALLQEQIIETNKRFVLTSKQYKENQVSNKDISQLRGDIKNVQSLLFRKDKEVSELQINLTSTQNALFVKNQGIVILEEKIKTIINQQESQTTEFDKMRNKLMSVDNKTTTIENTNRKDLQKITDLQNIFSELRLKLLQNEENIFVLLNSTHKEVVDVTNNIRNFQSQLREKDEHLKKEKETFNDRLNNLEQDIPKQAKEVIKYQNDAKLILEEKVKYILEGQKNNEKVLNDISTKFNLLDSQISKYKNYPDTLLSSRSKSLEEAQNDVRKIQDAVSQIEAKIKLLQKENINNTRDSLEVGKTIAQLGENCRLKTEEITTKLNENENEIKEIREKSDQHQNELKDTLFEKIGEFEKVRNNFTEYQSVLLTQEKEITNLQKSFKECSSKLTGIQENCNEQINNWKDYTNSSLNDKDAEIADLRHLLSEKDQKINALYESIEKLQGKYEYVVDKITTIENDFIEREENIRTEIKERDIKYDRLMKEVLKIKENMGTVEAV